MWVLEIEMEYFRRSASILTTKPSFQPPAFCEKFKHYINQPFVIVTKYPNKKHPKRTRGWLGTKYTRTGLSRRYTLSGYSPSPSHSMTYLLQQAPPPRGTTIMPSNYESLNGIILLLSQSPLGPTTCC